MNPWIKYREEVDILTASVTAWRVVETQNKSYSRKLVNSIEELDILEELLEESKPRLDKPILDKYHYLLFTPFRYPPLKYGSRFGRRFEPSLWYGSLELETALHEVAYYRLLFLQDTHAELTLSFMLSAFSAVATSDKSVDSTLPPFASHTDEISSPKSYAYSQLLGSAMRIEGIEFFLYNSARTVKNKGKNIGIFYPKVFKSKQLATTPSPWNCFVNQTSVEFWHVDRAGKPQKVICHKEEFIVDGAIRYADTLD